MKSNLLKIPRDCGKSSRGRDGGGERGQSEGKDFHTEEVSFRRDGLEEAWGLTSGRENLRATKL